MKKILMICLYPIAALLVVFAFLHFSYIIKYDNVDGFIIGMILLFLSIVICTIYAYISAQKKELWYILSFVSIVAWTILLIQNQTGFIKVENQNIIIYIVILFYVIILLPLFLGIKNYVIAIKKYN